ncbi:MAG: signal recognition particle-docking protein FtsY, partial [Polaromonas sp.]|nr:signal recognition particle-docking protein FtsY [Polaromonas sp.]
MFSFFKKKSPSPPPVATAAPGSSTGGGLIGSALVTPIVIPVAGTAVPERQRWLGRLQAGLRKTGASISTVFTGSR